MAGFDIVSFIQNNITTLQPSVQFVAGAVMSAMFLRKKTSIETGTQEFEKIKAAELKGAADMLIDSGRMTYTEFCKMSNYIDIARRADELRTEQTAEIPRQNFDWHTRFYEACGNITDEEMQNIWAQILSGEIDHPGSYSFRTLDCLRNLTREEAGLFMEICGCSVRIGNNVLLPRFGGIMEKNGITYDDVLKLEDYGLLKSDVGLTLGLPVGTEFGILASDGKLLLLAKKRRECNKERLELPQYMFTAIGRELYSVVGGKTDLAALCRVLQSSYQDFEFACGQEISRSGNRIEYVIETGYAEKI